MINCLVLWSLDTCDTFLNKRLQLVNVLGLHLPSIGPVPLGKVLGRLIVSLEQPLEPMQLHLAKLAAVGAEEIATVSKIQIPLPRRRIRRKSSKVSLGLPASQSIKNHEQGPIFTSSLYHPATLLT